MKLPKNSKVKIFRPINGELKLVSVGPISGIKHNPDQLPPKKEEPKIDRKLLPACLRRLVK